MNGHESFNELLLRYRGLLFAVCSRYARRGLEVDDLIQETTLALWNLRDKLFTITPPPRQAAWIWRVARSTSVDLLRRTPTPEPPSDGLEMPEEDSSLHTALHELINLLPEPDHTIITLHLEGYDYKEIGQRTGMTKNNVGVRLMRIKERLKKQWEE